MKIKIESAWKTLCDAFPKLKDNPLYKGWYISYAILVTLSILTVVVVNHRVVYAFPFDWFGLLFGIIFAWLVGTSEELNPLMQWELRVIDYVIPILNTIDIKWYAYPLDLLWVAIILAPIAIINASPYIIVSYIVDTILIRRRVKALIKEYSTDEKPFD